MYVVHVRSREEQVGRFALGVAHLAWHYCPVKRRATAVSDTGCGGVLRVSTERDHSALGHGPGRCPVHVVALRG